MQKFAFAALMAAVSAPVFSTAATAQSVGHASFYGKELAGRKTASGERFNPGGMTAAHRSLAFGTQLKLTNISNGRTAIVRINDRGPFVRGRVLDVSLGAAQALGFVGRGTASLRIEPLNGTQAMLARAPAAPTKVTPEKNPAQGVDEAEPAVVSSAATPDWAESNVDRAIQNR
jgi:rare lipoprotein A